MAAALTMNEAELILKEMGQKMNDEENILAALLLRTEILRSLVFCYSIEGGHRLSGQIVRVLRTLSLLSALPWLLTGHA